MTRQGLPVTVVVPVKNEEINLPSCLANLDRFDEVVVVDSSSTDRTAEIAKKYDARLINFDWNGRYPKKRNHVLLNEQLSSPWVLFVDADELVTTAFCDALAEELPTSSKAGYWLNYTNYFLDKELRFGVAQRKLALFRVGAGYYEKIEESAWSGLDMEIHEHPVIVGPVGEISPRIVHKDFRGIEHFLRRHIDYAKWEAARYKEIHSTGNAMLSDLTKRQQFKYKHVSKWWYPWFYFSFDYFAKGRMFDGRAGLLYAFYKAWYFATIRALIAEQSQPTALQERV